MSCLMFGLPSAAARMVTSYVRPQPLPGPCVSAAIVYGPSFLYLLVSTVMPASRFRSCEYCDAAAGAVGAAAAAVVGFAAAAAVVGAVVAAAAGDAAGLAAAVGAVVAAGAAGAVVAAGAAVVGFGAAGAAVPATGGLVGVAGVEVQALARSAPTVSKLYTRFISTPRYRTRLMPHERPSG